MKAVQVVVLGAGRMGSHIGCEYALAGHHVTWVARAPERARASIREAFEIAAEAGISDGAARTFTVLDDVERLDVPAEIVVESIEERMDAKVALLQPLARRWPDAVFATNTSSLSITALGDAIGAPQRTIGAHYWNPPLLMPLVEVIRGEQTSDGVVDRVLALLAGLGKRPVLARRDVPGFIWNRLQFALLREALWLVRNDVASPAAVDDVVRLGLARRWRHTGPFETAALGGVDTFRTVAATVFPELSNAHDADDLGRWIPTDAQQLASLAEHRDRALAAELDTTGSQRAAI